MPLTLEQMFANIKLNIAPENKTKHYSEGDEAMEYIKKSESGQEVEDKLLQESIRVKQLPEEQFRAFIGHLEISNDRRIQEYIRWIKREREGV